MFGCHCTRKLLMILEQLRSVFSLIKSTARNILSATTIVTHLTFVVLATKKLIVTNVDDKGESSITAPVLKYTNADIKRLVAAPSMETHLYSSKGDASSCFVCTPFEEFWHANKNFKDAFIKKIQYERPKYILLKICVRCKLPKRKNHRCDRTSKETTEFVNKRMAPRQVALCLTQQLPPGKHELSLPTHGKPRRILTNPLVVRKAPHTIDDMIEFERDECFSKEQARRVSTRIRKSLANVSNHDGPAQSAVEDEIYKRGECTQER